MLVTAAVGVVQATPITHWCRVQYFLCRIFSKVLKSLFFVQSHAMGWFSVGNQPIG